jgi:hypothetical protein
MDLKITGLDQVQRALKEAAPHIVARSYAIALDRAAGVIQAEVAARAEMLDESGSETRLADHTRVQVEVDTAKRGGIAKVGFDSTIDARTGIPQDMKALLVEAGHRAVTHKPGKEEVGHVPAHPFMRPAFEAAADRAIAVFGETLADTLSEGETL